jgi:methyl-accepting chemotaxis protein
LRLTTEKGKKLYNGLKEAKSKYDTTQGEYLRLLSTGNKQAASAMLFSALQKEQDAYLSQIGNLNDLGGKLMEKAAEEAEADYQDSRKIMWLMAALASLFACAFGWLITRSITRPLDKAVNIARTVAAGDLTSTIRADSKDETGQLIDALAQMNDNLKKLVDEVRAGTETITTASGEIAAGNQDLSVRTEHQAGSLEETASAMEQLTSTVRQNADNSYQANVLAETASGVAQRGGEVVTQVIHTMTSINESSRKIVDIISVIDSIAFQTNILALNAAVEAARAGEQGRGFAVVASEVRTLAQRSASAAKEIKTLIADSVEKVNIGSSLVDQAGTTMEEVVVSVKRVSDIISEITTASQEQSAGIELVNQSIGQLDQVTQQNAALVEQAAAAAQAMQDQAATLGQIVSIFKTNEISSSSSAVSITATKTLVRTPQAKATETAKVERKTKTRTISSRSVNAFKNSNDDWTEF